MPKIDEDEDQHSGKMREDGKESDFSKTDEDGKDHSDSDIIDLVCDYCWSEEFMAIFRAYFERHASAFTGFEFYTLHVLYGNFSLYMF